MNDLDSFLHNALRQQSESSRRKRGRKIDVAKDYARRLAEKALYRRLISDTDIAQDGIRFIWYFSQPRYCSEMSLEEWRRRIDKEIIMSRRKKAT